MKVDMSQLVSEGEDLAPIGHVRVDDDAKAGLLVVIEKSRRSRGHASQRKAEDEDILANQGEQVTNRALAQAQQNA